MKKIFTLIACISIFISCQKEFSNEGGNANGGGTVIPTDTIFVVDDVTTVVASVSGVVLDENKTPVSNITVSCGNQNIQTNALGIFRFKNIAVSKNNASVYVRKTGYFTGVRSFLATGGKEFFVKLQLIKKTLTTTIQSASGGNADLGNGASIILPAAAFSYSNGTLYSGNVNIYAKYINPQDPRFPFIMPGDLRGIKKNGSQTVLSSYGIIGADFYDDNGNKLIIASGKKATLQFPVLASQQPAITDSVLLWHFDEAKARWYQEGVAYRTGNLIKADVNKFSFWSIDPPLGFVQMSCTIMNSIDSTPVGNQLVKLTVQGTNEVAYGTTACTGFVLGGVPVNKVMQMDILVDNSCGTVLNSRTIGPFSTTVSLDTIWISAPTTTYTIFKGNIKNCAGGVAQNGYISLYTPSSGAYIFDASNSTAYFEFPVYYCQNTTLNYQYIVSEYGTAQQSPVVSGSTTAHAVNLGNVYACNTQPPQPTADVYVFGYETPPGFKSTIKYWKNGQAINVTDGTTDCYSNEGYVSANNDIYVAGEEWDASGSMNFARYWKNGVKTDLSALIFANSRSTGLFVDNTNVYISYDEDEITTGYTVVKLWKNGTSTNISGITLNCFSNCVYVNGTDVYIGGGQKFSNTHYVAGIWKNGVYQALSSSPGKSLVTKILVSGTDVYATGWDQLPGTTNGRAVIWKNGQPTYLTDGVNSDASANDIFIDGTDVYVCGRKSTSGSGEKAQLWKNGVATVLSVNGSTAIAQGLAVKNNNVYVCESGFLSGPVRVWKNNLPTLLTTGANFNGVNNVIVK